jgi:deoxyadenosine/deoxycytidine kinase
MRARLDGWKKVVGAPRVAFDRSIDEDIQVFCKMHRRAGWLSETQLEALGDFGKGLQRPIPKPDLIVFVTASPDVLLRRIRDSNGPPQIAESIEDQLSLYSEWLDSRTEEILEFDTTRLKEQTMVGFFREIRTC